MNTIKTMLTGCLIGLATSATCFAGWTSGGGELLKDAHNPWWLNNTKSVSYCVIADEANFGVSKEIFKAKFQEALNFWKAQFADAPKFQWSNGPIEIAQQEFIEVPDCANASLKLQMGVLDEKQEEYLAEPNRFVSIAVRTSYDRVQLRAKGFIYVAPQAGKLKPSESPDGIWSTNDGSLLLPTLIHELGHVFGLQHERNATRLGLMAEDFVEGLLNAQSFIFITQMWKFISETNYLEKISYFKFKFNGISGKGCYSESPNVSNLVSKSSLVVSNLKKPTSIYNKFLGLEEKYKCLSIVYKDNKIQTYASIDANSNMELVGEADLSLTKTMNHLESAVNLSVTKEQQVFQGMSNIIKYGLVFFDGDIIGQGKYRIIKTNQTREIAVDISSKGFNKIYGIMDGKFYPDISNNQDSK